MAADLELIRRLFHLDGEQVVRSRTGKPVKERPADYTRVSVWIPETKTRRTFKLHRIKFGLKHGYLPKEVDHRDRDPGNSALGNLRAASSSLQKHNKGYRKASGLPRGVERLPGGSFRAQVWLTKNIHLGVFKTPSEASAAVELWLKEYWGEDYSPR